MKIHKLKLNSCYYADSERGIKTFEIRKNDRDFRVGDILELREWVWSVLEQKGAYTGEVHWEIITYILDDAEYLKDGYVCLGVSPIAEPPADAVPVVRCGECQCYLQESCPMYDDGDSGYGSHYHNHGSEEWFCSEGLRKEAQHE